VSSRVGLGSESVAAGASCSARDNVVVVVVEEDDVDGVDGAGGSAGAADTGAGTSNRAANRSPPTVNWTRWRPAPATTATTR
jgi:hypothetical protein